MTAIDRRGDGGRDEYLMLGTARASGYGNAVVIRMLADMVTAPPGRTPGSGTA